MLAKLFEDELKRRGISQRQAAREIGTSSTTLIAMRNGRPLKAMTAFQICQWLGVPLSTAIDQSSGDENMIAMIAAVLKTAPALADILKVAAQSVEQGELTGDDFKEIVAFTAFKIQQRKSEVGQDDESSDDD